MILIDTSIWSLALRRKRVDLNASETKLVVEWERLIDSDEAVLIGPIRQEVLSGVKSQGEFETLMEYIAAFDEIEIFNEDYTNAAGYFNKLRSKGIVGTPIDLLICVIAVRRNIPVFSSDPDFSRYAQHLPVKLHT